MDKICIVLVGLPAMGKTTIRNKFLLNDSFVYSTDDYIESIAKKFDTTYNEVFLKAIKEATNVSNSLLDLAIKQNRDVIWDQTNIFEGKRKKIINRMTSNGYKVNCCFIDRPMDIRDEEWELRLSSRAGKTIPDYIIEEMYKKFEKPRLIEGFASIREYDMNGNALSVLYNKDNENEV